MGETSQKLVKFMASIENAADDLAWIRDVTGHVSIDDYIETDRMKRSSKGIDDILENFNYMEFYVKDDLNDELESGDAWYNSFRTEECKYINCKNNKPRIIKNIRNPERLRQRSRPQQNLALMENKFSKSLKKEDFVKKNNEFKIQRSHAYIPKQNAASILYGSHYNKTSYYSPANMNTMLNPISMNTLYGNSKNIMTKPKNWNPTNQTYYSIFQSYPSILKPPNQIMNTINSEQSGAVVLKDQLEKTKNDLSHEANYKLSKIEQEAMEKTRTSNISLPQNGYQYFQPQQNIGDFESLKMAEQPHADPKRSLDPALEIKLKVSNKMMSKGLGPSLPSDALDDTRQYISVNDILASKTHDQDPRDNEYSNNHIYKRFLQDHDEDFKRNKNFWENNNENHSIISSRRGRNLLALNDDQVVGTEKPNNITENKIDYNQTKYNNNTKANTTLDNSEKKIKQEQDSLDSVDTKKNQSLNTFVVHRNPLSTLNDFKKKIIEKRGLIFKHLSPRLRQRTNKDVRSLIQTGNDSPDDLVSGKLSSQLVQAIFELVKTNDDFRTHIWPGLKDQKITTNEELQDFSAIKNENNQAEIQHTEEMLRQVMETINNIIDQQVRSRTCLPLRPDLQDFYNQIIESRKQNEEKMMNIKISNNDDNNNNYESGHIYKRNIPDDTVIREKCSIVKKLLNQYDYLPFEDQQMAKELKDYLQMHLAYLNEADIMTTTRKGSSRRKSKEEFHIK